MLFFFTCFSWSVFSAKIEAASPAGFLLLGACVHSSPRRAEKNIYGEEASLRARCEKLCIERTAVFGQQIAPEGNNEAEERWKAKGAIKEEEGCSESLMAEQESINWRANRDTDDEAFYGGPLSYYSTWQCQCCNLSSQAEAASPFSTVKGAVIGKIVSGSWQWSTCLDSGLVCFSSMGDLCCVFKRGLPFFFS